MNDTQAFHKLAGKFSEFLSDTRSSYSFGKHCTVFLGCLMSHCWVCLSRLAPVRELAGARCGLRMTLSNKGSVSSSVSPPTETLQVQRKIEIVRKACCYGDLNAGSFVGSRFG